MSPYICSKCWESTRFGNSFCVVIFNSIFFKFIPRKIVLLLSFMGLVPKIDIRFVSNFKTYKALLYLQNRIFTKLSVFFIIKKYI